MGMMNQAAWGGSKPGGSSSVGGKLDEKTGIFTYDDGSTYQNPLVNGKWGIDGQTAMSVLGPASGGQASGMPAQTTNTPSTVSYDTPAAAPAPTYAQPGQAAWGGSTPAPAGSSPSPAPAPSGQGGAVWGGTSPTKAPGASPIPSPGAAPAPAPSTGMMGSYGQVTNSPVDYNTETIEGRLKGLLAQDETGAYTNQNVRQAVDRANQQFAARGLRNSSMAVQAAQEAAIAKAIEIAGPDAQTYFQNRRANIEAGNQFALNEQNYNYERSVKESDQAFTLRTNYQEAVQSVSANYQRQIDTINASNMTPEDKSAAIAQATRMRDGELAYMNNVYSRMPGWSSEWGSNAVPTEGLDVENSNDIDTLSNIANDPTQPAAMREKARQRIAALRARAPAPAPGAPAPAPGAPAAPPGVDPNLWNTATGGGNY